jgi:hypothetical protein
MENATSPLPIETICNIEHFDTPFTKEFDKTKWSHEVKKSGEYKAKWSLLSGKCKLSKVDGDILIAFEGCRISNVQVDGHIRTGKGTYDCWYGRNPLEFGRVQGRKDKDGFMDFSADRLYGRTVFADDENVPSVIQHFQSKLPENSFWCPRGAGEACGRRGTYWGVWLPYEPVPRLPHVLQGKRSEAIAGREPLRSGNEEKQVDFGFAKWRRSGQKVHNIPCFVEMLRKDDFKSTGIKFDRFIGSCWIDSGTGFLKFKSHQGHRFGEEDNIPSLTSWPDWLGERTVPDGQRYLSQLRDGDPRQLSLSSFWVVRSADWGDRMYLVYPAIPGNPKPYAS